MCSDRMGENIVFFTPAGRPLAAAPPLLDKRLMAKEDRTLTEQATAGPSADPSAASTSDEAPESSPDRRLLEQFFRELAGRAIDPDWRTNLPGFRHDHDIPWAIEAAAWEALEDAADEASSDAAAPDTMEESADLDPGDRSVDEAA